MELRVPGGTRGRPAVDSEAARVHDRILSLVPAQTRVVEFGHSGLSRLLAAHFEYVLVDEAKPSEHRDVPTEHMVDASLTEEAGSPWFHGIEAALLPVHIGLMVIHHRVGTMDASAILRRPEILERTRRLLIVSDDGEAVSALLDGRQDATPMIDDPDRRVAASPQRRIRSRHGGRPPKLDLFTRVFTPSMEANATTAFGLAGRGRIPLLQYEKPVHAC